jgi:GNAT superfamily N-acetyltransferase
MIIREMQERDVEPLVERFCFPWSTPEQTEKKWKLYYAEQEKGIRTVYLIEEQHQIAGYGSLLFESNYPDFNANEIPEIHDVWVHQDQRGKGFGSALLAHVESAAKKLGYSSIGLGVGLYRDYGHALRIYVDNGYLPDGKGATYQLKPVTPGESYPMDDELLLWFIKTL